jgi:hypothetical protein
MPCTAKTGVWCVVGTGMKYADRPLDGRAVIEEALGEVGPAELWNGGGEMKWSAVRRRPWHERPVRLHHLIRGQREQP